MAEGQPGPPGTSNHDDRPGHRPAEPLTGPAQPPAPLPGGASAPPIFEAVGPPPEALAGFWRRLVAAFLDWLLVGIAAAAIGERKRTWHDIVANSLVVGTTFYPPGEFGRLAR